MKNLQNSMLKKAKKGFTLTELAIVIAVIAILIAVLVPTFTTIITNSRKTSAVSNARNTVLEYFTEYQSYPEDGAVIVDGSDYYVTYSSESEDVYTAYSKDDSLPTYCIYYGELANIYVTKIDSTNVKALAQSEVVAYGNIQGNSELTSGYVCIAYSSLTSTSLTADCWFSIGTDSTVTSCSALKTGEYGSSVTFDGSTTGVTIYEKATA